MFGLTARPTSRADTAKWVRVTPNIDVEIIWINGYNGTTRITGSYSLRVHIDGNARHLDVGSSRPAVAGDRKGGTVRPRKRYVNWVQNVA